MWSHLVVKKVITCDQQQNRLMKQTICIIQGNPLRGTSSLDVVDGDGSSVT